MTGCLRLALAIHIHQPIGNFDGVFEDAYRDSYAPFLEVLQRHPEIPVSLHVSGSLMEWLVEAHPEYIDGVRELAERSQVELIGGPFYESILAGIPSHDRVGQISAYSRYLEQLFGAKIRGMWMPERVWEQSFASDMTRAGIEYTVLDDHHFKCAGLRDEHLYGYYLSEDEGRLLKIFPGSEKLRYTIPFAEPEESIRYLREIAEKHANPVVCFGDDGEKFGTWPGTKKHVYENGWLERFLKALTDNGDWLKLSTLSEAIDNVPPIGLIYLPDCSYREMTEWALPAARLSEFEQLAKRKQNDPDWHALRPYVRGGTWRNFRVKYPEANEMYTRMLQVSQRLQQITSEEEDVERPHFITQARTELYRGQCNCSYWHGAFGGLYLPHLRHAIYNHLIAADTLLESAIARPARWAQIDADDYNLDARKEIRIAGDRLVAFLAPSRGGHLYELDVRGVRLNLLGTLNRRPEAYHDVVRSAGHSQHDANAVASIHDAVRFKQPDLDRKLVYDNWPRKSLVDHFLPPNIDPAVFRNGDGEIGDFVLGVYETKLRRSAGRVEAILSREGLVGTHRIRLEKSISLEASAGNRLEIRYELSNLPPGERFHFAVEFNFAGLAAGASDRYFYDGNGRQLGPLESILNLKQADRIGLVDEWLGLDVALEPSLATDVWTFPIQTVSQSEGGFELVHQSSTVVPHWDFLAGPEGRFRVELTLALDTSAAHARELSKATVAAT
jgi:4-alpha-glucanotransferase